MLTTDVDYNGELSGSYEQGRGLSADAVATWRQAIAGRIPDTGLIVDVGAGTGRFARELDRIAPGRVLAVEPSAGMRKSAPRSDMEQIGWLGGGAEALPLRDESVGLVWSAFTTHYFGLDDGRSRVRSRRPTGRPGADLACVP